MKYEFYHMEDMEMKTYFKEILAQKVKELNDIIKWSIENGLGGKEVVLKPHKRGAKIKVVRV